MTTTTTTSTAPAPAADDLRLHDLKTYKHCHEIFTAAGTAAKRAAGPLAINPVAEPAVARLRKRDEIGCYLPQMSANLDDCSSISNFMRQYGGNLAIIPAFDEVYWELDTCTLGATNRTPCTKVVPYEFFAQYCYNMVSECIYYGRDGYFDIESNVQSEDV
ncbi:hypothetical protein HMPREF1624_07091 [Sporothrix schenckii ATCC 58251]|uniref:Uncharacterized protein n=1 Tax=Sporothrix schenckii (strain ATCC 58251 / de Perez 2211183) TaxID=1391915 RepID=U7PKK3_SPOS1|nr:hypothetical protein HMPREF1624_07091 [Sporothrix schenckii ATCC 58251]